MPRFKTLALAVAPALLGLSACATPGFRADVSRFQQLPAPQGQTFVVQSADPRERGGLEFSRYAALVAEKLTQQGYRPATNAGGADLVVFLEYGVDNGREVAVRRPGVGVSPFGYGGLYRPFYGYGGGLYGRGFYGRPGGFYRPGRLGFYYGWDDPFWYSPFGYGYDDVREVTVYESFLDMDIKTADGRSVFEGKAEARSRTDDLPELVPNLVEAMFKDFPGRSGESVKITVPPAPRRDR